MQCRICGKVTKIVNRWKLCETCLAEYPYACSECGKDLKRDEVYFYGSQNLCASHGNNAVSGREARKIDPSL